MPLVGVETGIATVKIGKEISQKGKNGTVINTSIPVYVSKGLLSPSRWSCCLD